MGGKEAIRGFLYQGFASILEALTQEGWDKIYVEYPSSKDKVDIAIEINGKIIKSIQVKSSINQFQKSAVAKWIEDLVNDINADKYEVILIGPCSVSTNDFINSIIKYKNGNVDKKSKKALENFDKAILENHNINIKSLPFDEQTLLSLVRDSLHKYISFKGYNLDFESIELLAQSTLSTQMLIATKENGQTKQEFDSKIFQWINLTSGGLKNKKLLAKHNLLFYDQEKKILSDTLSKIYMDEYYYFKKHVTKIKNQIIELIKKIDNIKLNSYERKHPDQTSNIFGINTVDDLLTPYAETSENEKEQITNKVKSYFDIELTRDFFFVGNLKEQRRLGLFEEDYKFIGSGLEKEKNNYINEFKYKLLQYEMLLIFIQKIKKYFVVPIVIQNVGEVQDENITIKLLIDKSIKVFCGDDYLSDKYLPVYMEMISYEDNFIESIFKFKSDRVVNTEKTTNLNHVLTNNQRENNLNRFYNLLNMYIAKPQYDDSNHHVFELEIKNIRPNECKFTTKLILLDSSNNNIEIRYSIISNYSDGSNEGVLRITD